MDVARALIFGLRMLAPPDSLATPRLEIDWQAPPECVERDELVARTEALLGRPLAQPGDPELEFRGEIMTDDAGLLLRLEFRRPVARVREFRAGSCVELRDAAAMVLAVTIDPLTSLAEPEAEAEAELEPEPEPEPNPEPQAPASRRLGGLVRLGGGVLVPILPGVAGGPSLAVGLRWRALRAELVASLWLTPAARYEQAPEVGATISLGMAAPRVCGVPRVGLVEFPLCVGLELGGMRGAGFGTPAAVSRTLVWIAAELGAAASIELGRSLALWVGVDGVVPLTRPGFSFAGLGQLHRAPSFGVAALLGLEIHFGARE